MGGEHRRDLPLRRPEADLRPPRTPAQYYATSLAFFHGTALCESEGIPADAFCETALPFLSGFVGDSLRMAAKMIKVRDYAGSDASLNVHAAALGNVIKGSDRNQVDRALPECLSGYLKNALAAGHGDDELAAVFEMFRSSGR